MPTDIRLSIGFFTHPKTRKLRRALGDEGVLCLLQLWCYVATNRPRGNLDGLDIDDIEIAADWQGEQGAFFARLVSIGWIEQCENDQVGAHWCIHDWADHNPWAYGAPDRIAKAKKGAKARWDRINGVSGDSGEQCSSDAKSNATSINEQCLLDATIQSEQCPISISNTIPIPISKSIPVSDSKPETLSDESLTRAHERVGAHVGVREVVDEQFDAWWALYPGKGSKAAARKAWDRLVKTPDKANVMLVAAREQVARHNDLASRGSWVPLWRHGSTWLNQAGWDDDPIPERIDRQGSRADTNRTALAAWMGDT